MNCIARLIITASLALTASGLFAQSEQDERAKAAVQIQQTLEELQAVRSQQRRQSTEHSEQAAALGRQIELLKREQVALQNELDKEQVEIESLAAQIALEEQHLAASRAWIEAAVERAAKLAASVHQRIESRGGGLKVRRASAVEESQQALKSEDPARQMEGWHALLQAIGDEWLPARSMALSNQPLQFADGDEMRHAWVLDLGLVSRAFVSEDGHRVGISRGGAGDWNLDLTADLQLQIQQLISIAREQQPPSLSPAPVSVLPGKPKPQSKKGQSQ